MYEQFESQAYSTVYGEICYLRRRRRHPLVVHLHRRGRFCQSLSLTIVVTELPVNSKRVYWWLVSWSTGGPLKETQLIFSASDHSDTPANSVNATWDTPTFQDLSLSAGQVTDLY